MSYRITCRDLTLTLAQPMALAVARSLQPTVLALWVLRNQPLASEIPWASNPLCVPISLSPAPARGRSTSTFPVSSLLLRLWSFIFFYHRSRPAHSGCSAHLNPTLHLHTHFTKSRSFAEITDLSRFPRITWISEISCPIVRWHVPSSFGSESVTAIFTIPWKLLWGAFQWIDASFFFVTARMVSTWRSLGEWKILSMCLWSVIYEKSIKKYNFM